VVFDEVGEACGVIAVFGADRPVASLACDGLVALQHRGQESAGIVVGAGGRLRRWCGPGLAQQAFADVDLAAVSGRVALGHVRYSTAGGSGADNVQPMLGTTGGGEAFALAHNGNLLRVAHRAGLAGRRESDRDRSGPADTAVLVDVLGEQPGGVYDALLAVLPDVDGAYSIAVVTADTVYAARDPHGFRPLCVGRLGGDGWVVASESAALDSVGARFVREVEPGELVTADGAGLRGRRFAPARPAPCVFEYVYFARPDSVLGGLRVQQVRRAMGTALAAQAPAPADVVVPVPDTARPAALGYAQHSGIPYDEGLVRNGYLGRTFIRPHSAERQSGVRLKFNALPEVVGGRRVALVDDSLVRASSARGVVALLRRAGATEVHLRIASAPVRWPCFFGVDMDTGAQLVAHERSVREVTRLVGADSLGYLSVAAMVAAAGGGACCAGCFTGVYPTRVPPAVRETVPATRP
jgi:amidophosphoribosyltransferase